MAAFDLSEVEASLKPIADESSCANLDEFCVRHVSLELEVDMAKRRFFGHCMLSVERLPGAALARELVLDAHESMTVQCVLVDDRRVAHSQARYCDFGDRLAIDVGEAFARGVVDVVYETSGEPAATWLDADQAGGRPFVYTMGQACLNRSLFPCQDAPRARVTWSGKISAPADYRVVAAAEEVATSPGCLECEMRVSVPPYLVALAVGDLAARDVGPRSRVYARPGAEQGRDGGQLPRLPSRSFSTRFR